MSHNQRLDKSTDNNIQHIKANDRVLNSPSTNSRRFNNALDVSNTNSHNTSTKTSTTNTIHTIDTLHAPNNMNQSDLLSPYITPSSPDRFVFNRPNNLPSPKNTRLKNFKDQADSSNLMDNVPNVQSYNSNQTYNNIDFNRHKTSSNTVNKENQDIEDTNLHKNNYDDNIDDTSNDNESSYQLSSLKQFMANKRIFIKVQFVSDNTILFLKVYIENIGENLLVYFPSKYNVIPDKNIPIININSYDLMEEDFINMYQRDEQENKDTYNELNLDDLKDKDSYATESYKPIDLDNSQEHIIRKNLIRYHMQLEKFKNCTTHIKYKFAILTNKTLSVINRHNETECFVLNGNYKLVSDIIHSKTERIIRIPHELYILIDLPSFYEKIDDLSVDLIKVYRNFYATLNRAHTKQTSLAEFRFRNYNVLITQLLDEYSRNAKFLNMISSLTTSLDKSVIQEKQLIEKNKIWREHNEHKDNTVIKDTERTYNITKFEKELSRIREIKSKSSRLLHEIKNQYNAFLLSFDTTISEICRNLKAMEMEIARLDLGKK